MPVLNWLDCEGEFRLRTQVAGLAIERVSTVINDYVADYEDWVVLLSRLSDLDRLASRPAALSLRDVLQVTDDGGRTLYVVTRDPRTYALEVVYLAEGAAPPSEVHRTRESGGG